MNICMLTNTYLPHVGGVARSVHTFAEEYRRQDHEVLVVAPTFPELETVGPEIERHVVRVPAVQKFNGSDFSVRLPLLSLLHPRVLGFEADIYHSHHPFLLGDTALRLGADKGVPVVFTHHTLYEEYVHYVPFSSKRMASFVVEMSTHYANLCDAVVAPSESIATLIRGRGVEVPVTVIPTGIDVAAFAGGDGARFRRSVGIADDALVVGTVGRLAPEKNLGYLSRALARFLVARPEAVFLVVGAGPSAVEMKRVFELAGFTDRLVMAGKRSGGELYDAYGAMNLFAFSSFSETQGLVLAEAMAAGLPVVALDASGVREVLRDGQNGFMLPASAGEEAFVEALEKLAAKADLRSAFREEARRTAERFSRESCAERALTLYHGLIQESARDRDDEWTEGWTSLLQRVRVEWELLADRTESAFDAFLGPRGKS